MFTREQLTYVNPTCLKNFIWKLFGIIQDHQFHFKHSDFLKGTQHFEKNVLKKCLFIEM